VTTGAVRRAKLQSDPHHQQISTQFFIWHYRNSIKTVTLTKELAF